MARIRKALIVAGLLACCAAAPLSAVAGPKEEAKAGQLFDKAEVEYQAGRFQAAIDLLLEAQRIAPDAVLDYNLARAYEGLGNLEASLASYKAYLVADPQSKDRGAVEARIKTIEAQIAERAKKEADEKKPPPPQGEPSREPDRPSALPWLLAGAGALTLGAGGVLGGLSLARSSEADDPATSGVDAVALSEEASDFALQANVLFGVGGAIALAGAIWGIVDVVQTNNRNEPAVTVRLLPWGAALRVDF
jgi:tetratricopeptide (TPR) repeat protein